MTAPDYPYVELEEVGKGGMAYVYRARRRGDSHDVASKRPMPFENCNERLAREISVLSTIDHPNVMPILEHGIDGDGNSWYTMPMARGSLSTLHEAGRLTADLDALCRRVLDEASAGLGAMHDAGYIHRDVTPGNILALEDEDAQDGVRWVIGDCGLVRRPLGETTLSLTGSASVLGTLGFIAPEALGDPHGVTAAADVYSLGRILAWLLTGKRPVLTEALQPRGDWRPVVRLFTQNDPAMRPQSMQAAHDRAHELLADLPLSDQGEFRTMIAKNGGRLKPGNSLWQVLLDNIDDYDFMIDDVVKIEDSATAAWTTAHAEQAAVVAERMARHLTEGDLGRRNFDRVNNNLDWILTVIRTMADLGREDLVEDVFVAYCAAVAAWDRYSHNARLRRWLSKAAGPVGRAIARAIRDAGELDYFRKEFGREDFRSPELSGLLG